MEAEEAYGKKTLINAKNKAASARKSDTINTIGAYALTTAGVIMGVTVLATATVINVGLIPPAIIMAFGLSGGSYILAGKLFAHRINEDKKRTAMATILATSIALTPISALAISNPDFRNGLEKDLNRLNENITEQFNNASSTNNGLFMNERTFAPQPEFRAQPNNNY